MDLRQRMGEDWTLLAASVRELDVEAVTSYIENALKTSRVHYRVVQRSLENYCFSQVSLAERLTFILYAVPRVTGPSQHMLIELLKPECVESASQEHRDSAAKLFWQLLNRPEASPKPDGKDSTQGAIDPPADAIPPQWPNIQNARVAVKLFLTLDMTVEEIGGLESVRSEFVAPLLRLSERSGQGRALQPVLSLAARCPKLLEGTDSSGVLSNAVEHGQNELAFEIVQQLPLDDQRAYVEELLERNHLKAAAGAVRKLDLQEVFPQAEPMYRAATVRQLLGRGRWSIAAEWTADDSSLQLEVVEAIAAAGEVAMAKEYAEGFFGVSELSGIDLSDEALQAAAARRKAAYFSCKMDTVFVDSLEHLPEMQRVLEASTFITIDVEWRPNSFTAHISAPSTPVASGAADMEAAPSGASSPHSPLANTDGAVSTLSEGTKKEQQHVLTPQTSPAATLQIAADMTPFDAKADVYNGTTGDSDKQGAVKVFVIDLLKLGEVSELDAALSGIMQSPAIPKIGLELSGDLSKLACSYPNAVAFQQVLAVLDLQKVWMKMQDRLGKPRVAGGNRMGLSSLSDTLLGKPLDKSMQVSDWSRRPLSASQLQYAAMDAAVQVHILRTMCSQARLSQADLTDMFSDWPSSNSKKRRTVRSAGQEPTSQRPNDDDDDYDPPAGGAGFNGSAGIGSSLTATPEIAGAGTGVQGSGNGAAKGGSVNGTIPKGSAGDAGASVDDTVLDFGATSNSSAARAVGRTFHAGVAAACHGSALQQRGCTSCVISRLASCFGAARRLPSHRTVPQRSTAAFAGRPTTCSSASALWVGVALGSGELQEHGTHAKKQRIVCNYAASMLEVGGRGKLNMLHKFPRLHEACRSCSSARRSCFLNQFGDVDSPQYLVGGAVHARQLLNLTRKHCLIDAGQFGLCGACLRQFGRPSCRFLSAAAVMTHAVQKSARVPVLCRAPCLRQQLHRVHSGARVQLLKM